MFLVISGILFFQEFLLWSLLVRSKKSMSDEEEFVEDNWQMEWLKSYNSQL